VRGAGCSAEGVTTSVLRRRDQHLVIDGGLVVDGSLLGFLRGGVGGDLVIVLCDDELLHLLERIGERRVLLEVRDLLAAAVDVRVVQDQVHRHVDLVALAYGDLQGGNHLSRAHLGLLVELGGVRQGDDQLDRGGDVLVGRGVGVDVVGVLEALIDDEHDVLVDDGLVLRAEDLGDHHLAADLDVVDDGRVELFAGQEKYRKHGSALHWNVTS